MTLNEELRAIRACPSCKQDIRLNDSGDGLICDHCTLLYPFKDDIPVMIVEEADKLDG